MVGGRTPRPTGPKARVPVVIADTDRFTAVSRLLDQADTSPDSRVQFRSWDEGRAARWADRITGAEGRVFPEKTTLAVKLMRTPLPLEHCVVWNTERGPTDGFILLTHERMR